MLLKRKNLKTFPKWGDQLPEVRKMAPLPQEAEKQIDDSP